MATSPTLEHVGESTAVQLAAHTLERRAIEAAIWGMPLVAFDAMRQAFFRDAGASYGDIVYLSKPADWKFQVTTPNASARYVYIQINTKDGPQVLDIPPAVGAGLFGSMNDAWQAPQADVGPAGQDGGKGGKYLLLPPNYTLAVPQGYFPVRFNTYNGYCILRAIPASNSAADVSRALDLVRKIRLYRLAQVTSPREQRYVDIAGKLFDCIVHFDESFYDSLARMIDEEPVQTRDLIAMAHARTLGVEKGGGKPFKPPNATAEILERAVGEAHAGFSHAITVGQRYWPASGWYMPGTSLGPTTGFTYELADRLDVDERAMAFYLGCAPPRKLGAATFYLWAARDASGEPLQGGNTYRLRVPPNVPAKQFWAATVYDVDTAAFFHNAPTIEVNSYGQGLAKNPDGSVDVHFGPVAPNVADANWVYTAPGKSWISAFRFYGPGNRVFDKTWVLPDIEKSG